LLAQINDHRQHRLELLFKAIFKPIGVFNDSLVQQLLLELFKSHDDEFFLIGGSGILSEFIEECFSGENVGINAFA
jgi:hypothetical protein